MSAPVGAVQGRRSRGRTVLLVVGVLAAISGVLAGAAAVLLLGPLREAVVSAYDEDTRVRLERGDASVTVAVERGWRRVGVLPDADELRLESPDGRYRATLRLTGGPDEARALLVEDARAASGAAGEVAVALDWRGETLPNGLDVEHADWTHDAVTHTYAVLETGRGGAVAFSALVAGEDAARYRTETADLLSSVAVEP